MNAYETLNAALTILRRRPRALEGSPPRATWSIGAGRVTTEELESWQLGPDLTGSKAREDRRR